MRDRNGFKVRRIGVESLAEAFAAIRRRRKMTLKLSRTRVKNDGGRPRD